MATELDNFYATCEHRRPGRILFYAHFVEDLHRRVVEHIGTEQIAEYYGTGLLLSTPARNAPDFQMGR